MNEYMDDFEEMLEDLGPKTFNKRSLLAELGPNTNDRSTWREHSNDHGDDTEKDALQPCHGSPTGSK